MTLTRTAFFRSLLLAPGAAIAAADRPVAEKLADAEELKPAAAYKFQHPDALSAKAILRIQETWKSAWKGKGLDAPLLFILEEGADIKALPSSPVTVNVNAVHPSAEAVADAVIKHLREMKVEI